MRIVTIVGTRPQLIKIAALQPILRADHDEILVDTGQHWDDAMAGAFFTELGLARPDHSLGIGGGRRGEQIGRMLVALEPILGAIGADAVVVVGDTNSTAAGAIAGAAAGIPVAHVEAGLRSFDRRMPEETNRVIADHLATWNLAPTPTAVENLRTEGIVTGVELVGDLMADLAAATAPRLRDGEAVLSRIATQLGLARETVRPGGYVLATIHRADNRTAAALEAWSSILTDAAAIRPTILALHPGTRAALEAARLPLPAGVVVVEPLGYATMLALELHAAAVITDSGGVQREAGWLGVPCLVLRATTEWREAVADSAGRMVVVGLDRDLAAAALDRLAAPGDAPMAARERAASLTLAPGRAAAAIVAALDRRVEG